jgi:DNA-binding beta-propeller fold protein YncE
MRRLRTATGCLLVTAALAAGCGAAGEGGTRVETRSVRVPAPPARTVARVGVNPTAVAVADGRVWVANNAAGTVSVLDARHGRLLRSVAAGRAPVAIAAGPAGVWIARGDDRVVRLDARSGRRLGAPVHVADPAGVAVGRDAVWVTSRARDRLVRIDPRTGRVARSIRVGDSPTDVALAGGDVWVANSADGTVTRVDPRDDRAGRPLRVARRQVLALAAGPAGLWVAGSDSALNDRLDVLRIDPGSGRVAAPAVRVTGGVPLRLAVGRRTVWATDVGSLLPGAIRRPSLLRVAAKAPRLERPGIRVGAGPAAVAVGADSVWVANSGDGTVTRVAGD